MPPMTRREIEDKRTATAARYAEPGETMTRPEIEAQRLGAVRVHLETQDWWEQWKAQQLVPATEFVGRPMTPVQERALRGLAAITAGHEEELAIVEQLRTTPLPQRRARAAATRRLHTQQNHTARRARRRANRERTTR